jgi:hypothetical protein
MDKGRCKKCQKLYHAIGGPIGLCPSCDPKQIPQKPLYHEDGLGPFTINATIRPGLPSPESTWNSFWYYIFHWQ